MGSFALLAATSSSSRPSPSSYSKPSSVRRVGSTSDSFFLMTCSSFLLRQGSHTCRCVCGRRALPGQADISRDYNGAVNTRKSCVVKVHIGATESSASMITLFSRSSRVVLAASICSSRRAVPQAAHFGEGSPGEMAFSRRFAFGLVTCFRMKVACSTYDSCLLQHNLKVNSTWTKKQRAWNWKLAAQADK